MTEEIETGFWQHVEQLRTALLRAFFVIGACSLLCFCFHVPLMNWLKTPLHQAFPPSTLVSVPLVKERLENHHSHPVSYQISNQATILSSLLAQDVGEGLWLIQPEGNLTVEYQRKEELLWITSPLEGMMVSFKISLWAGILLSSPLWLFFIVQFIHPGLNTSEQGILLPFLTLSIFFVSLGLLFCRSLTLPFAIQFFSQFNQSLGVNHWILSQYLDFSLLLFLGNALAFELLAVLWVLVRLEVLSSETMVKKRRQVIIGLLIVSAILTPPDIVTQCLVALPLILLYEVGIFYAMWRERKKVTLLHQPNQKEMSE